MGWPWSSWSSPSAPPPSQEHLSPEPPQSAAAQQPPPPLAPPAEQQAASAPSTPQSVPPRQRTRDEQAHDDLLTFLYTLEASYKTLPPSSTAASDDEDTGPADPNAPTLITPAHIYPVRLSCTLLFDSAFHCSSPLGQFLNVYRYGTFRPCNRLWNDFLWCMRTNRGFMAAAEREERTLRKGWQRERDRLVERGGTSEEIWERRRWLAKDAFAQGWGPSVERRGVWPDEPPAGEEKKEAGRFA